MHDRVKVIEESKRCRRAQQEKDSKATQSSKGDTPFTEATFTDFVKGSLISVEIGDAGSAVVQWFCDGDLSRWPLIGARRGY